MKKLFLTLAVVTIMSSLSAQNITLPAPAKTGGMPLYEALMNRQTNRTFASKQLTEQQISDLLWCANGINRQDGKRTAPSARNCQEIDIYVFMNSGIYFYNAEKNMLELISAQDGRNVVAKFGDMVKNAPLTLLFVANYDKMPGFDAEGLEFYGATDAGYVSQNVYLYCAANGLNTVVMGAINRPAIKELIKFNGKPVLAQPVGYPVK